MATYLIIERYKSGQTEAIYARYEALGRMLPGGVEFVNSWVTEDLQTCYQVMRSPDRALIQLWIDKWSDLVDFEVMRVLDTAEVQAKLNA